MWTSHFVLVDQFLWLFEFRWRDENVLCIVVYTNNVLSILTFHYSLFSMWMFFLFYYLIVFKISMINYLWANLYIRRTHSHYFRTTFMIYISLFMLRSSIPLYTFTILLSFPGNIETKMYSKYSQWSHFLSVHHVCIAFHEKTFTKYVIQFSSECLL